MIWFHALALAALAATPDATYAWPLDLPRVVTSSFAEYRFGRFHAGIDLRTNGIGQPVHAPADGHVARVSCSPWGYGKGLFLQLADGNTAVFGHLSDFAPAVRDYVHSAQHERKSYSVDLEPDASMFPVKRGDIVAFSGDTGIGVAHLHYEVRDPHGSPMNPCLVGATWPDPDRPVIHKVLVVPDAGSTVDGDLLPMAVPLRATGSGTYTCNPIKARGRIGIGINVEDPANGGASKLGVYRIRTRVDGADTFDIQMDHFGMDKRYSEKVSYYPFALEHAGGPFLLQWRWPGNDCEIFRDTDSDGWIAVPDHPVEIQIEAADFQGNKALLTLPIRPDAPTAAEPPEKPGKGKGTVDVTHVGTWLVVTADFDAPESIAPEIQVEGGAPKQDGFVRIDATTFRTAVTPSQEGGELVLRVRHERIAPFEQRLYVFRLGEKARTVKLDGASLTVQPQSPFGVMYLRQTAAGTPVRAALPVRGGSVRLSPAAMPVNEPITVTLPVARESAPLSRLGVYRDNGDYWSLEAPVSDDGAVTFPIHRLGAFAVLEDNKPPSISNVVFGKGTTVATKRPTIGAAISDVGSGISDVGVTCNGQWLTFAYDPETGRIAWERDEDLPAGPKEFVFTVTDKAGNSSSLSRKFEPEPVKAPSPKPATSKPQRAKAKKKHSRGN